MPAKLLSVRRLHRSGASQQVTIPRDICTCLQWQHRDRVYIYVVGEVVVIRRWDEGGFAPGVVAVPSPGSADIEMG